MGGAHTIEPATPVDPIIATVEPATPVDQVIATVEPTTPVDPVIATVEPTTPVIYAALPGDMVNAAEPGGSMQHTTITPDDLSSASHVADTLPPSTLDATSLSDAIQAPVSDPIVHSATTIRPDTLSSASHVDDTTPPLILDVTGPSDAIQAPMSDLQLAVTTTEPAAQVNAALPSDVTATALEPSGPMQGTASASHVDDTTPPLILT
jgi:hypothetical protein